MSQVCVAPPAWEDCINNIIKQEEYTQYEIEKRNISTEGGNFVGLLYEVNVKGETVDGEKETHLFVKSINLKEDIEKPSLFPLSEIHNNERFIYSDLSKVFDELQDIYNVPIEDRYKMAKCYDASNIETLVMENLSIKGFKTYNRMEVVSLKFAELSFKAIARFHGMSYVLRETRPEYFSEKIKSHKFPIRDMTNYSKVVISIVMGMLEDETVDKIKNKFNDFGKQFIKHQNIETRQSTLCHGDFRPNNILTYFNDGEATEIIPIDYQLIFFGCPVLDLFFFLYICTDREFRKIHLTHLKDLYHDTMDNFLKYFEIDIKTVFPKKDFLAMFDEKKEFGLLVGLLILPLMFANSDDLPDLTGDLSATPFKTDDRLKARLLDVVEDFKEWEII